MASVRERNGKWQARVLRNGYPPQTKTFDSHNEAIKWSRSIEVDIDQGSFISPSHSNNLMFKDIVNRYIQEVCPSKRGGKEEAIRLNATMRLKICTYSMNKITPRIMAEYRDQRLRQVAANTVIRELAYLSSIINHARREWGVTTPNPCLLVKKPQMPAGRDRTIDAEEEVRLINESKPINRRNAWLMLVIIIALETAMRRGEILSLKWEHINLNKRTAYLPMTKNGTARTVPLSSKAVDTLRTIPHSIDGRVFPLTHCALHAAFRKACKRAKLDDVHFHDLRHTATTRLAEKLPNVLELASVTGHKTLQMLKRYYHPRAEDIALKLG
ncbi:MAG: tyrosine-type recombinase/integrase [Methylotenera sp.]